MNSLSTALSILAAGVVLQNLIFARGFCTDDILRSTRTCQGMLRLGAVTTVIALLSTVMAWALRSLFGMQSFWNMIRWVAYLFCVIVAYVLMHTALYFHNKGDKPTREQSELLLRAGFNGAVYGIVLITSANYAPLWQMLLYAVGCCMGLTAAQLLIHAGNERIELCSVPKPFAGVPILMIYVGILSLAIYGLIGHQIPT